MGGRCCNHFLPIFYFMEQEIWKPVKGYENYEVSSFGRVRCLYYLSKLGKRVNTGNYLKFTINRNGYYICRLSGKTVKPHRLVCIAFHENKEDKPCVNHKDLNKLNNRADNLEWCTVQENARHAWDNGACLDSLKARMRFSLDEINQIQRRVSILGAKIVSENTGIPYSTIWKIATNSLLLLKDNHKKLGRRANKPILDINSGVYYMSAIELSKLIGITPKEIQRRLNGERINNTRYIYA